MRRLAMLMARLLTSLLVGPHSADAARSRCENTHCGWYCTVYGPIAGYCNTPAESAATGCIQLYGPDCASMENAYCCVSSTGAL